MCKYDKRDLIEVEGKDYTVIRVAGEKKGGRLYIATDGKRLYTIWIMKEDGDREKRVDKDVEAGRLFAKIGIRIPKIVASDRERGILVREYFEGDNASTLLIRGSLKKECIEEIFQMAKKAEDAGICINYFPTNYLCSKNHMYYLNYEYYDMNDKEACAGRYFEDVARKYWIF